MLGIPVLFSFKSTHWGYSDENRSDLEKQDLWANAFLRYHVHTGTTKIWPLNALFY